MSPNVMEGYDASDLYGPAVDTLPITFAIIDEDGVILSTNDAWSEFGRANDIQIVADTIGVNYLEVTAAADDTYAQQAATGLRAVLAGDRTTFELEYPCHSPTTERWFLLRAAPFTVNGSRYASIAHINITDRKARESALETAYDICTDTNRTFTEQVDTLLGLGRDTLDTAFGTLSRVHGDEYVFEAVSAPADADLEAGTTAALDTLPNCRRVAETRETLALRDVGAEAPELADPEWGIENYVGAPVIVDGDVYGTFCFYGMEPRDLEYTQWDLTFVRLLADWAGYELERQRYTEQRDALSTALPDPGFIIDAEGRYLGCLTDPETMLLVDDPQSLVGQTLHDTLPTATADALLETVRAALRTEQFRSVEYELSVPSGDRWFEARVAPFERNVHGPDAVMFVARDITIHKKRQRELKRQRDELEQAQRLNALGREIAKALQDTRTREEIEAAVCTHLTESDLYQTVWTGTRESETAVTPTASAGVAESALDTLSPQEHSLAIAAIEDGDIHVVEDITAAPMQSAAGTANPPVHDTAAVAAVPLTAGETTYGVLLVYAPVDATIGARESDILADLGRLIALSIQRVHSQRSLLAATAVKLEFLTPDSDAVFADLSASLDCTFDIERRIPTSSGDCLYYVRVDGADTDRVHQALRGTPSVESCTVIEPATDERAPLLEVSLDELGGSPLDTLTDYGGVVTGVLASDGDLRFTAELAPETDIRAVVEAVRMTAPDTELRSKQHFDQPVSTATDFQSGIRDRLTPKQATALKTAYARGYYDWPRKSSAEELAETLDISAPTLHYRLRKAHDAVVGSLFDAEPGFEDLE